MSPLRALLPALLVLACAPSAEDPLDCSPYTFETAPVPASAAHLACSSTACGNGLVPPSAGDHCAETLACGVHASPQSSCRWLHNLEHGHAVFLYNCPEGCPELVERLRALAAAAPRGSNGVPRALVAPDPGLPTRAAALLWRLRYLDDDPTPEALACFLRLQDTTAPEKFLPCAG